MKKAVPVVAQSPHFYQSEDVMLEQQEFHFYFQSLILLPHILAPEIRCYTEDVVKILDQIVNNNLRQISTYNFKKLDWIESNA